jgi:hypothetical protein
MAREHKINVCYNGEIITGGGIGFPLNRLDDLIAKGQEKLRRDQAKGVRPLVGLSVMLETARSGEVDAASDKYKYMLALQSLGFLADHPRLAEYRARRVPLSFLLAVEDRRLVDPNPVPVFLRDPPKRAVKPWQFMTAAAGKIRPVGHPDDSPEFLRRMLEESAKPKLDKSGPLVDGSGRRTSAVAFLD